jgi:hypothetical protein
MCIIVLQYDVLLDKDTQMHERLPFECDGTDLRRPLTVLRLQKIEMI